MNPLRCLALLGCVTTLALAGGCKRDTRPRVAFVTNNPESFWSIAEVGAKKAADEKGVLLLFRKPSPGTVKMQKEEIENVLNRGVKALAVSVIKPKEQAEFLDTVAGKADLLTQDNDAPGTKRLAYIGTNNYEAGRAAGKLVKEALGDKGGTVIIFVGELDPLNARQRRQGVIDELGSRQPPADLNDFTPSPDGELLGGKYLLAKETYTDQPEGSKRARTNAETAIGRIKANEDVCMVGLWAYNPPAILGAVKDKVQDPEQRKRIKIVAFDEDFATLDGIKDGSIYATVVQDPYNFGYESVTMMAALAKGDRSVLPKGGMRYIPHRIIAQKAEEKNGLKRLAVDGFRAELEGLLGIR